MIVTAAVKKIPMVDGTKMQQIPDPSGGTYVGRRQTRAKQPISPELAKKLPIVYRCSNGISDDIANMELHQYIRIGKNSEQVPVDAAVRNMAYLCEVAPNRWMNPFIFKKTVITWLQFWGNALVWMPPPPAPRELFILPVNCTFPKQDAAANVWYEVNFPSGDKKYIPFVEVLHVMLNTTNGIWGRSILEYAADTLGLRVEWG